MSRPFDDCEPLIGASTAILIGGSAEAAAGKAIRAVPAITSAVRARRHMGLLFRGGTRGRRDPTTRARSLDVPAEVDLHLADLVAVEGEDLRVAKAAPVGLPALVGDDDLVAGL